MFSFILSQKGSTSIAIPTIMSVLMGVAAFSSTAVDDILAETRDTRRSAEAYQITVALAQYYDDNGFYPQISKNNPHAWEQLGTALEPEYVQSMPQDPGEYAFDYESDGQKAIVQYYSEVDGEWKERWSY